MSAPEAITPPAPRSPLDEASDPATPAARLHELARNRGPVGRAVAGNPNTAPQLLIWLSNFFLAEFLANPALPLLLLENPGFALQLPENAIWTLLRDPEAKPEFLAILERHPDEEVREAARFHVAREQPPELPGEDSLSLAAVQHGSGALMEVIQTGLAPEWLLRGAMESGSRVMRGMAVAAVFQGEGKTELREHYRLLQKAGASNWLAGSGKATEEMAPETLARLAAGGPFARLLAARHPAATAELLQQLIADPATPPQAKRRAFAHRAATADLLLQASLSNEAGLRAIVARHPSTPAEMLERLASDPAVEVRRAVAANRRAPEKSCAQLAGDGDDGVRKAAASNPVTPAAALHRLVDDSNVWVRRRLGGRKNCPLEILRKLMLDEDFLARAPAAENRAFSKAERALNWARYVDGRRYGTGEIATHAEPLSAEEEDLLRRRNVGLNREGTPEELALAARDPDEEARINAARNDRTPADALRLLGGDPAEKVRAAVAYNGSAPPDVLARLAQEEVATVRHALASNASAPLECLRRILEEGPSEARARLIHNKACPVEWMDELARLDDSKEVRQGLGSPYSPLSGETVLWLYENGFKDAAEWGRDTRFPVEEIGRLLPKLQGSYHRGSILSSNDYRFRHPSPYDRVPPPAAIPTAILIKMLDFDDDKYDIHRNHVIVAIAQYSRVEPEALRHCAEVVFQRLEDLKKQHRRSWMTRDSATPLAAIARAPACPPDILARIAGCEFRNARLAALAHPKLPEEARQERRETLLAEGGQSPATALRLCALSHPDVPLTQLRERAWVGRWSERFIIAQNPRCPRDVLALLSEDANLRVRGAARVEYRRRFPDGFLAVKEPSRE